MAREAGQAAGQGVEDPPVVPPGAEVRAGPGASLGRAQPAEEGREVRAARGQPQPPGRDLQRRDQALRTEGVIMFNSNGWVAVIMINIIQ